MTILLILKLKLVDRFMSRLQINYLHFKKINRYSNQKWKMYKLNFKANNSNSSLKLYSKKFKGWFNKSKLIKQVLMKYKWKKWKK